MILGLVKDNAVDFAVAPFGWRKDRLEVVDWIPMNDPSLSRIYIQNPKDAFDWLLYLKPLRDEAWIGVVLYILIVPIILLLLAYTS